MSSDSPYVLAIDLGTSAVKVAVVSRSGQVLASASETHRAVLAADGTSEQDAEEWWTSIGRCARAAIARARCVPSVVAVTSQFMSVVAVDAAGVPLAPVIMWTDRRGESLHPLDGNYDVWGQWIDVHGLIPLPADDVAHIHVLRSLYPAHLDRLHAYVEPSDAIASRLVGRVAATPCTAFWSMCTDNRDWHAVDYDDELLGFAGLDRTVVPPIVAADVPLGAITASGAEHLGVTANAIVMPATADTITSAIGSGAIEPSCTALVIGTTAVMATHIDAKRNDLGLGLSTIPSPLHERYVVMAENGMGGKALDVFVNNMVYANDAFSLGATPDDAYERAERAAATVPPGAEGVQFFPWLHGSISPAPDDDVRGAFVGISQATTRSHMARAVMEGVALNAAWLLDPFSDFVGAPVTDLNLGGGGARSDLWSQIVADATGRVVHQLDDPAHTNCRGAALLALAQLGHIALGDIASMAKVRRTYEPLIHDLYIPMLEKMQHAHAAMPR